MISGSEIRKKLRQGLPSLGTWLQLPSGDVAEIIGRAGYEWAAVDMEHGAFNRCSLPDIFRALELGGVLPFARLLEATSGQIKSALDSGARGLIFPMIESFAELDAAISAALYPGGSGCNSGRRGVGFSRANLYGRDLAAHVAPEGGLGGDLVIVAQIEHINALRDLEKIFAHPRLDAYMIGPYDLSASMNLTGRFDHPDFIAVLDKIAETAARCGLPKGFHVVEPDPGALEARLDQGYTFLAYGLDAVFLARSCVCPKFAK